MGKAAQFQAPDLEETGILDRAAEDWGWKDQATRNLAIKWYVAFLEVVYNNPGGRNVLITREADQLWHTHITFTVKYRQYCEAVLGFYLDHTPQERGYRTTVSPKDVEVAKQAYKAVVDDWSDINVEMISIVCW